MGQLRRALGEVGAPVAAAAATTFGAAVFLLFCIILPFRKLGVLICAHTAFSGVAALVVIPAILVVLPNKDVSPAREEQTESSRRDGARPGAPSFAGEGRPGGGTGE